MHLYQHHWQQLFCVILKYSVILHCCCAFVGYAYDYFEQKQWNTGPCKRRCRRSMVIPWNGQNTHFFAGQCSDSDWRTAKDVLSTGSWKINGFECGTQLLDIFILYSISSWCDHDFGRAIEHGLLIQRHRTNTNKKTQLHHFDCVRPTELAFSSNGKAIFYASETGTVQSF